MSRVRDIADNSAVFADGISTADITEGSNLFFTNSRADARITLKMIDEDNMSSDSAAHMPSQQSVKAYIDAQTLVLIDEDNMATNSATRPPSQQSVKAFVDTSVAGLVDSAPGTLDTLNELAAALGDDASFSTTITNSIATKLPLAGGTMTGNIQFAGGGTVSSNGAVDTVVLSGSTAVDLGGNITLHGQSHTNASQIFFKNGSTNVMTVASGKVGIGTNNPGSALHVVGPNETTFDGITTVQFFGESNYNSGDAGAGILFGGRYNSSNNTTTFAQISGKKLDTADTTYDGVLTFGVRNDEQGVNIERMRITNTGNVGIGTTNPGYKLQVNGNVDILNVKGIAGNAFVRFTDSDATADFSIGADDGSGAGSGAFILYDRSNSAYRLTVDSSG